MDRQKIVESFTLEVRGDLRESEAKEVGNVWTAPVWKLDEKNLNGHTYTRALAEKICKTYKQTMAYDGHDADIATGHDFAPAIAIVKNPRIEKDEMIVDIEFLETEAAKNSVENIKTLYQKGLAIGVSSVGYGSCDADGVIGEDYEVVRFLDFVAYPAGEVYAEPKTESAGIVDVEEKVEKTEETLAEAEEVSKPSVSSEVSEGEEAEVIKADTKEEPDMVLTEEKLAEETQELEEARNLKETSNMNEVIKNVGYSQEALDWSKKFAEAVAIGSTYSSLIPKEVSDQIEMKMNTYGQLRKYCTVHKMGGTFSMLVEDGGATASWAAEAGALTETSPSGTALTLTPQALTALVKVSRELAADTPVLLDYVVEAIAKGFAKAEDKAILTGAGYVASTSYEPAGIITKLKAQASTPQIVTGTGTSTSVIGFTWAELKQTISKIGEHRKGAVIIINQEVADHIYEMKDGTNYIFDQTKPLDSIWGMPVIVTDLMDSGYKEASSGKDEYPVVVANLSYYHLGDRQDLELRTLNELYAANRQIGIVADKRIDGNFGNYSAFAAMKIAKAS